MIRDRLRTLLGRSRGPTAIGEGFDSRQDGAFAALDQSAEGSFAVFGSAMVASWEVLITDLSRSLTPRLEPGAAPALVERISDALVPTLTPVQAVGKRFQQAGRSGVRAALQSGRLRDATDPLVAAVRPVGAGVEEGWAKSIDYLGPLYDVMGAEGPAGRQALAAGGPALRLRLDAAADGLARDLGALPAATELAGPLVLAVDAYAAAITRAVEDLVYERRTELLKVVDRMPSRAP
jgi:hypothetical protein